MAHRSKLIIGSTSNVKLFELTIKTFKKHVEGGLLLKSLIFRDYLILNKVRKLNCLTQSFTDLEGIYVFQGYNVKLNMKDI